MAVALGGTLVQHLPTAAAHAWEETTGDKCHMVRAAPGSFLAGLYGERFAVNSAHHQAADRLGSGLRAVQWAEDGVVEALCHRRLPVWAVQWHPEELVERCGRFRPLFRRLVELAGAR